MTAVRWIKAGPGAGRGREQAGRPRRRHVARQPPGAAAASLHPQDGHDRRLRRRRQLGGIGSINWGGLRDRGNILRPASSPWRPSRASSSCAATTCRRSTTPMAPTASSPSSRCRWRRPIAGSTILVALRRHLATAARFANALAHEDAILKKLVSRDRCAGAQRLAVQAAPESRRTSSALHRDGRGACARRARGCAAQPGRRAIVYGAASPTRSRHRAAAGFECTWNHTTLHALKDDRTITYLQTLYPPPTISTRSRRWWPSSATRCRSISSSSASTARSVHRPAARALHQRRAARRDHRRIHEDHWLPDLQSAPLHARRRAA